VKQHEDAPVEEVKTIKPKKKKVIKPDQPLKVDEIPKLRKEDTKVSAKDKKKN
jgi:hypothetical protein